MTIAPKPQPTACIVIIGNEILSGRTHDKNTLFLTGKLTELGINPREVRVVPDVKEVIVDTVRECSERYDYVFTTGGIGPTHDDITADSIAACFGVKLELHPDAHARLKAHYGVELNDARIKMGLVPEGASLIQNPVSAAPGFHIKNVFVMAGIPSIMQVMFDSIKNELKGGEPTKSITVSAAVTEGIIAKELTDIQNAYPNVDIGSYPFIKNATLGVSIVVRGLDMELLEKVAAEVKTLLQAKGVLMDAA